MYKSCLLFVLHVLTAKIEVSMPVRSLNIDLSNVAICILSCSSEFMNKNLPSSQGFVLQKIAGGGRGRWGKGVSQSFGNVNHPCSAVWVYPVLDTHTSSDRKLSYSGPSQYALEEYSFLLCRFLYTINFTTLSFFCDCYGFLKKTKKKEKVLLFLSQPDTNIALGEQSFLLYSNRKKRFFDVLAIDELIKGLNSQQAVHLG